MSAKVAIIGRPNVGKSTLFNRLVGRRLALVDDEPGVTRDRREGEGRIADLSFTIVDTAGLEEGDPETLAGRMRAFLERYDYLACPVTQVEPFAIEQEYPTQVDGHAMGSYIEWMRSNSRISATLCPAISVPVGFSPAGLPVGLQLVARPFGERALLEVAHALEMRTGLAERLPPLAN